MADDFKKRDDKGDSDGYRPHSFETLLVDSFVLVFGLLIVSAVLGRLALIWGGNTSGGLVSLFHLGGLIHWFAYSAYPVIVVIVLILSVLFIIGTVYAVRKLTAINKENQKKYGYVKTALPLGTPLKTFTKFEKKNNYQKKWAEVLTHASSNSQNDWKVAIIDADAILDDVLIEKGYLGDTMGDRLKSIDRADLKTLDLAWDAHKYRNGIAHGEEIEFNQHEVRRIISCFEKVFRELKII